MPPSIITLTTDFGLSDPYAGQMKAVILSLAPEARLVDLTHDVAPQAVAEAAFILETSWSYFPAGTVHLVVVDPGVGTQRSRLAIESQGHFFVGPDNGCLSAALPATSRGTRAPGAGYIAAPVPVPPGLNAVSFERLELLPRRPSPTFEGRDVFAPLAARLALGAPLTGLGTPPAQMLAFPAFRAPESGGVLEGVVIRTDRFGNLMTDIHGEDIGVRSAVSVGGRPVPLARIYAESRGPAAIVGSSGYLEIAVANGSAAAAFGAGAGTKVRVEPP